MPRKLPRLAALASFCAFAATVTFAQAVVTTYHNDNQRTGQNLNESILNTANVKANTFGLLFSEQITNSSIIGSGGSYTQPLCVPNLNIGGALHNVVFIATSQNTIMAFDADKSGGPLWTQQYASAIAARSAQSYLGDAIGILSTPVIDRIGKTMYFVTATELNGSDVHFLHAIDITNGAERFGGPVQIRASVPGSGDGGSTVSFNANEQNPRPALMLSNGQIYMSWGSYDDDTSLGNYHGWVMAYDAQTLAQTAVFNSTPNGSQASTWALGALAADSSGNVFVGTANGSTDTSQSNFGDSYLKLDGTNLSVLDYFTPYDWFNLNDADYDLNGGGAVLLPDQPGSHPHLLVWGSKAGKIYLDDRDSMGMLSSSDGQVVQSIPAWSTDPSSPNTCQGDDNQCVRTLPAYWNGNLYFIAQNHGIQSYALSSGLLSTQPTSQDTTTPYFLRGAAPSISSSPDLTNGIVWAVKTDEDTTGQGKPVALYAYDATDVSNILYNSNQNSGRDGMFPGQLFSTATVANGKVYVAGREQLYVFGLLAGLSGQPPVANVTLSSPSGQTVTASTSGSTDSNGNIVSSWIDFGDGTIVNGTTATHTYANPGSYTVVATVYDNSGRVSRTTTTAAVNDPPSAVTTYHNDNARTGQQLNETILTPSNVNSSSFGKKYSFPVDGQVFAQPLYVPGLTVNGATHNVVFVATEHDSVYAFDADGKQSSPLWQAVFINPPNITPAVSGAGDEGVSPEIGVTGTPVIDLSTGTLYVLAMTNENGNNKFRLHALDITTGAEKFGGPALVQPSVKGTGAESVNGVITINPGCLQRTGLALLGNTVVMAFGSCSHGWVVGFNSQTLQQTAVFNPTPDDKGAGIWMGGGAPAIDSNSFLYLITGADADSTGQNNNSFLEFDPNMNFVDFFTPSNTQQLIANDEDLGSGGVLVLPDNTSSHPHEMIGAGKDGRIFVIDRDTLGGFSNPDRAIQEVQGANGASDNYFDTPAFWNGNVYYHPEQGVLQQFTWSNGTLSSSPAATGSTVFGIHGATPSISANGTSNAILWELQVDQAENKGAAVLHAYDATNVAHELYNSSQAGSRDTAGPAVKFAVPTIADDNVFVGTSNELDVYGLLNNTPPFGYLDHATNADGTTTAAQNAVMEVSGWAADNEDGSPVARVQVFLDGNAVGNATLGLSRPDVASAYNRSDFTKSGWSFSYQLGSLNTGAHQFTAVAYDSQGASTQLISYSGASTFTVDADTPPFGYLQSALNWWNGDITLPQYGNLQLFGWAADNEDGAPLNHINVLLDGRVIGEATLGESRPDVAKVYGRRDFTNSGWTFIYNIGDLSVGAHSVTAVAFDSEGVSTQLTSYNGAGPFTVQSDTPPFGYVDHVANASDGSTIVPQNGTLNISGWAADNEDGAPLPRVAVLVDGSLVGNGTLELPRPDVASVYQRSDFTNSGWFFSFSVGAMTPGTHWVTAIAYDSQGASATLSNYQNIGSFTVQ